MQNKKETSDKLDHLLKAAANDAPVMSIDDVQQLLKKAPAPVKGRDSKMWVVWSLLFLSVSTLTYVVFNQSPKNANKSQVINTAEGIQNTSPETQPKSNSTVNTASFEEVEKADNRQQLPESSRNETEPKSPEPKNNDKNSIAEAPPIIRAYTYYYSRNDKKIAVTVIDGEVIRLTEDEIELPKTAYNDYDEIITKSIRKALEENRVKALDEKDYGKRYLQWKQKLTDQLVNDNLIENDAGFEFAFENSHLYINGIEQPAEIFEKYKTNYEKSTGKKIHAGTSLTIRKQ